MKFTIQKLSKSQVEISFEISAEDFKNYYNEAISHLSQHLNLEGFRSGHIPKEIAEKTLGQEKIMSEAANLAINESYLRAVSENKLDVILQPEVEILKIALGSPFEFKAKVLILPEIELPDYKKIASEVKKDGAKVEEKEIEETLKWIQKSRAKFTLKTEPCQKGDFVEINYSSPHLEMGKEFKDGFILGEGHFVSGFEENLEGMKANEEKEFSLKFPENKKDLPAGRQGDLAGKTVNFKVKITNIQKMELSEINDEWAKTLGKFENLESLKKGLNEGILKEKEIEAVQKRRGEILDKIAGATPLDMPETLISAQQNQMMENLKNNVKSQFQISFEDYLTKIKKPEKEIYGSFRNEAEKMVKNSLILKKTCDHFTSIVLASPLLSLP